MATTPAANADNACQAIITMAKALGTDSGLDLDLAKRFCNGVPTLFDFTHEVIEVHRHDTLG